MKNFRNLEHYGNRIQSKNYIEIRERVRYSETDQMGVAHNKSYFEWFEVGRTAYCDHKNIPYSKIEALGYYLVVVEAHCNYKKPLRYDEPFLIRVTLEEISPRKALFSYTIFKEDGKTLAASGYTVHVVTDRKAKVCSLPQHIVEKIAS